MRHIKRQTKLNEEQSKTKKQKNNNNKAEFDSRFIFIVFVTVVLNHIHTQIADAAYKSCDRARGACMLFETEFAI